MRECEASPDCISETIDQPEKKIVYGRLAFRLQKDTRVSPRGKRADVLFSPRVIALFCARAILQAALRPAHMDMGIIFYPLFTRRLRHFTPL